MHCPYCNAWNNDGAESCENCQQDLTTLDQQPDPGSLMEASIMESHLYRLKPKKPVIVPENTTVAEAIDKLRELRIGCVLVGTVEHVAGIFSERDVLIRVKDRYEEAATFPVSSFMTTEFEKLDMETPIAFALNRMAIGNIRHLPVTRNGLLAGIISLRDVLRFMNEWYPDLINADG